MCQTRLSSRCCSGTQGTTDSGSAGPEKAAQGAALTQTDSRRLAASAAYRSAAAYEGRGKRVRRAVQGVRETCGAVAAQLSCRRWCRTWPRVGQQPAPAVPREQVGDRLFWQAPAGAHFHKQAAGAPVEEALAQPLVQGCGRRGRVLQQPCMPTWAEVGGWVSHNRRRPAAAWPSPPSRPAPACPCSWPACYTGKTGLGMWPMPAAAL